MQECKEVRRLGGIMLDRSSHFNPEFSGASSSSTCGELSRYGISSCSRGDTGLLGVAIFVSP